MGDVPCGHGVAAWVNTLLTLPHQQWVHAQHHLAHSDWSVCGCCVVCLLLYLVDGWVFAHILRPMVGMGYQREPTCASAA
jgi:hypothetical protein